MKIERISFKELKIPFKTAFQHASAKRLETETVITCVESESGQTGFGEGCPRSYVTGETLETCYEFFETYRAKLQQLSSLNALRQWTTDHQSEIDSNPAAWCSIELALLDLFSKENGCTVDGLLSLPEISNSFEYTAVLGLNSLPAFSRQLETYLKLGFRDYKIKISGNLKEDQERIKSVATAIPKDSRIRLDANNVWSQTEEAISYLKKISPGIWAIEEPLAKDDLDGHRKIFESLGLPIILDESFCNRSQFQYLKIANKSFIINLRVSKMGGLLRSLDIAGEAQRMGIPLIIGAQVGETSLLTRAALTVCSAFRKTVLGQEGAFGTYLLEHDLTRSPLMLGHGGMLNLENLPQKPGLGLEIDPELLSISTCS